MTRESPPQLASPERAEAPITSGRDGSSLLLFCCCYTTTDTVAAASTSSAASVDAEMFNGDGDSDGETTLLSLLLSSYTVPPCMPLSLLLYYFPL